ncbi:MAG: TonB-dependent receptor [Flavobacteriales bacterium]|nr:TonB-dependent receptor [Flavobacteriales bacterium]
MKNILTYALFFFLCSPTFGQFGGKVSSNGEPVPFATITGNGVQLSADVLGTFSESTSVTGKVRITVSAIGYEPLSLTVFLPSTDLQIELKESTVSLDAAVVSGSLSPMSIRDVPAKIEVMNRQMLQEIPVANLTESIQFQNGVQEVVACGVCATSDIHINGIEGAYTLVLIDGMPVIGSLASIYGLSGIPSSMIEQVEIIKGPASALYGSEAMGGVINIITRNASQNQYGTLSLSGSDLQQQQLEGAFSIPLNDRNALLLSTDIQRNPLRFDRNGDGFTDIPTLEKQSFFSKWQYRGEKGGRLSVATRLFNEQRFGGQLAFDRGEHLGGTDVYGEFIETQRAELFGTAVIGGLSAWQVDWSMSTHDQDSYYGDTYFAAKHNIGFANIYWNRKNRSHDLTIGTTQRVEDYADNTAVQAQGVEYMPGAFIQDLWKIGNHIRVQPGFRADIHPIHGVITAPRLNAQWSITDQTQLRFSAGKGFREVNLITEDHAALTGSREVLIIGTLNPEISYSYSGNIRHSFTSSKGYGVVDLDVFHTLFSNRILPDFNSVENAIVYSNIDGNAVSQGIAFNASFNHISGWNASLGTTLLESFERTNDGRAYQVLTPSSMSNARVAYVVKKTNTKFSWNALLYGPMRLPEFPEEFSRPTTSEWFSLQHLQISQRISSSFDIELGIRNILNYTQDTPLVDPANPFSEDFDTSYAYGPMEPRNIRLTIRWSSNPVR